MKAKRKPWEVKSATLKAEQRKNREAVDAMAALAMRVAHLELALKATREKFDALGHVAEVAAIDEVLSRSYGEERPAQNTQTEKP